jgi:hypothetical protein
MSLSQDAARRKPDLHFDQSRCHMVRSVPDEMATLQCKRVAHPPYFRDLAICELYLLSRLKNNVAGSHADDEADVLREVQGILAVIDRTEVKNAFGHWIEQCQWVATNKSEYYLEE